MRFTLFFTLISYTSFTTARDSDPIAFRGHPYAETSLDQPRAKLYAYPKGSQVSGAKFFYDKNTKQPGDFPLAVVYLSNKKGNVATLQTAFDTISQTCSCYWLDAQDLVARFPKLVTGYYFISMEGKGYKVRSGKFKLVTKISKSKKHHHKLKKVPGQD